MGHNEVAKLFFISLFVYLCVTQDSSWVYTQVVNNECKEVQPGTCIPCNGGANEQSYYIFTGNDYAYYYVYQDTACTLEYYSSSIYQGSCNTFANNCSFFTHPSSVNLYSLTISTSSSLSVAFRGENTMYGTISSNTASIEGVNIEGFIAKADGERFFFERQVSETQYTTNRGAYSFGQTYTSSPFTFTVDVKEVSQLPSPPSSLEVNMMAFFPAENAHISDSSEYKLYYPGYPFILDVFTDSQWDLSGLSFSGPCFSFYNFTFWPPMRNNEYGNLGFNMQVKSYDIYRTQYCDGSVSGSGDFQIYGCPLVEGSLSGSGAYHYLCGSSFLSADEMAFALF